MMKKNKSDKRASHYKYIGSNISSCTKKSDHFRSLSYAVTLVGNLPLETPLLRGNPAPNRAQYIACEIEYC